MKILQYLLQLCIVTLVFAACDNEDNENIGRGESISSFKLVSPANFTALTLNPGTPQKTVVLEWEAARTGLGSTPTYRFLLDKVDGDFSAPLLAVDADNEGKDPRATLTMSALSGVVANSGSTDFIWTVEAKTVHPRGENTVKAVNAFALKLNPSATSIGDFTYLEPSPNQKLLLDGIRTPNQDIVFSWTAATSAQGTVKYKWVASATRDGEPVLTLDADDSGTANTLTLTHKKMIELLDGITYTDGLYWRVQASVNDFSYSPETRFVWFEIFDVPNLYIVGSFTNNWANNCTDAIQLTNKGGGVFESLINIPASAEFKFVLACGNWDVTWGSSTGSAVTSGTEYAFGGDNIKVQNASSYFVRADLATGKFKVTEFVPPADMFLVGGSTSADWNTGNSIKFVEMGNNVFEIYAFIETAGGGFKFLQVQDWAGDWGAKKENRTVNDGVISGDLVQDDEENATVEASGFYRITLDYNTLKYKIEPMAWGIVGSARTGDDTGWSSDDDMTFVGGKGSYKWIRTITLMNGKMKFRANDGWDVNFGDTGANGSLEYGGDDINITAGTYLIELILHPITGYTYTITPQ
jgi:hypothetical protein